MKLVENLRGHLSKKAKAKIYMCISTALVLSMSICSLVFAATPAPVDMSDITNAVKGSFDVKQIALIIAAVLGISVTPVLLWWGGRKLVHSVQAAILKGKLKL